MKLFELARARAGDKGNVSNIVVVARSADSYEQLVRLLTAVRVKEHFQGVVLGEVVRYELPKLRALNFVLQSALQGGVTSSTSLDAHGKSLSSALLSLEL